MNKSYPTKGVVRLARGVVFRWWWVNTHDYGANVTRRPRVKWWIECHETIIVSGYHQSTLVHAKEVALRQARNRFGNLLDLLKEAQNTINGEIS